MNYKSKQSRIPYPEENHNNVCLWDMDGTLVDYDAEMSAALRLMRSPEETWTGRGHDIREDWMKHRIDMIRNVPGFWSNLPWHPRGSELVRAFEDNFDFENHILTKGPTSSTGAWTEKVEWCRKHVPEFHVTISGKKSLVYGKVLVDDWPQYFMPWLEVRPRGVVVAVAAPWNEGYEHDNLVRYDGTNLNEVLDKVSEARGR